VGTPLEVYNTPASKFVAGFIGAPHMNFADVTIREQDGALMAACGDLSFAVPPSASPALGPYTNKTVTLGIRPEHIEVAAEHSNGVQFSARINLIEQMGSEIVLETESNLADITVSRVDPQFNARLNEDVPLSARSEMLHFFDADTGAAIR
jgi:multiple sugar transport system ATP-binding protein